jgi:hypothetical protein
MLPTADDLDDPDGFVHRENADFSELDKMLGDAAEQAGSGEGDSQADGHTDSGADGNQGDDDGSDGKK